MTANAKVATVICLFPASSDTSRIGVAIVDAVFKKGYKFYFKSPEITTFFCMEND
jgi:hypothetical protein